jgi:acyl carrier protein
MILVNLYGGGIQVRQEKVNKIIAEHLKVNQKDIEIDKTLEENGCDDLDVVEIILAIENQFKIRIEQNVEKTYTPKDLYNILVVSPTSKTEQVINKEKYILYPNDVGEFVKLSEKNNPYNLTLVFVPELKIILEMKEEELGRKLNEFEVNQIRKTAIVVALPRDSAVKFHNERSKKH